MILPARRPATAFGVADPFPPSDLSGSSRLLGRSLVAAFGAGSVAGRWLCLKSTAGVAPEPLEAPPGLNAPTMCWRCSGRFSPYSTTGFPSPFFPVPLPLALLPFVEVLLRSCSGGLGFSASHSSAFPFASAPLPPLAPFPLALSSALSLSRFSLFPLQPCRPVPPASKCTNPLAMVAFGNGTSPWYNPSSSLSRTSFATMQNYLLTNLSTTERLCQNRVVQECIGLT